MLLLEDWNQEQDSGKLALKLPFLLQERSMFIGHFGVALAAKKAAPRTSLGILFLARESGPKGITLKQSTPGRRRFKRCLD